MNFKARMGRDLRSCQFIASDKTNLMKKVHFFLKKGFPSYSIFYSLRGVGYLIAIVINFV